MSFFVPGGFRRFGVTGGVGISQPTRNPSSHPLVNENNADVLGQKKPNIPGHGSRPWKSGLQIRIRIPKNVGSSLNIQIRNPSNIELFFAMFVSKVLKSPLYLLHIKIWLKKIRVILWGHKTAENTVQIYCLILFSNFLILKQLRFTMLPVQCRQCY